MTNYYYIGFAGGLAVAAAISWLLARCAPALRLVDVPADRHTHKKPTPRIGGLAIAAGMAAGTFICAALGETVELPIHAISGALALLMIGVLDDIFRDRFPWFLKFLAQLFVAAGFCWFSTGAFDAAIITFLVFAVNAYNFFDHADGLLTIALIPGAILLPSPLGPAAAGALASFFIFNILGFAFAGDAGSQALSFLVVAGALEREGGGSRGLLLAFSLASLPFLDAVIVIFLRAWDGVKPWISTADHLDHRWRRRALMPTGALVATVLWAVFAVFVQQAQGVHGLDALIWPLAAVPALVIVLLGAPPLSRPKS